jgi:hypothetical protein
MHDVHYDHAARAACHVVNTVAADLPKVEMYERIVRLILQVMQDAQAEIDERRLMPSEN